MVVIWVENSYNKLDFNNLAVNENIKLQIFAR